MKVKILKLDDSDLKTLLARWYETRDLFSPVEKNGMAGWKRIEPLEFVEPAKGVPKTSLKTFFFPQPETLLEYSARPGDEGAYVPRPVKEKARERIILGVRPCDARSVLLNSLPFADDPYFKAKKDTTLIVGFTCKQPCSTCFCSWAGGSPMDTEGMDIAMTRVEGGYLADILTKKGEGLVDHLLDNREASPEEKEQLKTLREQAQGGTGSEGGPAEILKKKNLMDLYNAPFWQGLADSCINCGACTFLCPTCYCFDIQDETIKGKGRRIRYWDSCMFPLFTQHASGHNPRSQKVQRVRNRFMHKLKYFPERFGPLSCVGCGRCIRECPVNIDIREVMRDLLSIP